MFMKITSAYIQDVKELKLVATSATVGVGLLTSICFWFCNIFGIECKMYAKKLRKPKILPQTVWWKKPNQLKRCQVL